MMNLEQLKQSRDLVNKVDWQMTPEKAVEMYLEWGTGWVRGNDFVSSSSDESIYFVVFDWEDNPHQATLVLRDISGMEEIAKIDIPAELFHESWHLDGKLPGGTVHPPSDRLKEWLCGKIDGPPLDWRVVI